MMKSVLPIIIFLFFVSCHAFGADISVPEIQLRNNEVLVSAGLLLDEKNLNDIQKGISKEITFYVDIFRVWKVWPDEFIAGRKIIRTLESDTIKKEYTATSFDGTTMTRKRFRDMESMLAWSLHIKDLKIINAKELEAADYFARVTVEAHLIKLPPVIDYLLFFVPAKDFKTSKNSPAFHMGHTAR